MQQQEITVPTSEYASLTEAEQEIGVSRVTLRKYLRQLGVEPRSFGIGGRTLYISNREKELVKQLKQNPSLLEFLKNQVRRSA
ncbi:MAG TPA: hypothetical protein VFA10_27145 [Ktedonobacteraceae bacterium]|nr:hypothetical protein [Ktedonobacteraceae bacterium]